MTELDPSAARDAQEAAWRAAAGDRLLVVGSRVPSGARGVRHRASGDDGYEVAKAMRSDPAVRGAFLIALTGYALPDDQRRAADAGFDVHLAKPITIEH